ncbi:MAG: stalk domain-containing protein [Peptoniphilus duerdenii]|uniref:stalk domain-containing protein n=1 Tax=Peptoniphilus duerdenii TaxID=507750 RepID=UPI00254C435C|nr:stalk domain-containing protein [Peptoniphilus duerdenii]MDK8276143.1 stalk domain-containing protein [Peptoniphilus duerdenii]
MKTKNSKKVLALILSFFMILTVLPFNVMAEDPGSQPAPGNPAGEQDPTKYDVTYIVKGLDQGVTKTFAKEEVVSGGKVTLPTDTAVNGYKFKGFFEDEQGATAFNAEKAITTATTIYAIYEKEAPVPAKKELKVSAKVYYDAITGTVTDKDDKAVEGATVSVFGRTTKTDAYGNFSFNMTKESGNYYCGYYGYYWKDYPYNSSKVTTTTGYYKGYNNSSYGRYFFLVDAKGAVVNSVYAKAYENYYLSGDAYTNYTVYSSEYGYNYGYNYGYPYYDKYYNRYYNPKTDWAYGKTVTATKDGYEAGYKDLYNVTNNSWLYTTCYEYGYPYGYDRVIYPSALSLSGNGTIVSGKVGVSYLPIYVYRNGVFLGSGNADVNGYFSIGLNSRVSSTSDLTFYAYGKTEATPQKKADHGVIPVKSTVVIGSTKLIKNINGVEADVNMDVAPFIRDGRTMLPLRYIAEALGFKVDWDRATRTVTLTDKEFKVQIPVETNKIIVNGSTYYSDANPVLRNGRTMLPVANIARALGLKDGTDILWDANTRVATITRLVKY